MKKCCSINEKDCLVLHKFAHEIKNPLSVCQGYLDMISDIDYCQQEKYFNIIREEINRSLSIIDDFSKKENYEEFDLVCLYEDVKEILYPFFKKNNCEIILMDQDELYVKGDYNKLKQVLLNIIKNAYEARTMEKLLIVIETKVFSNYYLISITDNGCGMSKNELNYLFREYYTTKRNGMGLGLSNIKEIIAKHRGRVSYESIKNLGTKVCITLPKKVSI